MDDYIKLSSFVDTDDYKMFVSIINQDEDERFEDSKFELDHKYNKIDMYFHKAELDLLIKRLEERNENEWVKIIQSYKE